MVSRYHSSTCTYMNPVKSPCGKKNFFMGLRCSSFYDAVICICVGLKEVIRIACVMALVVGSELHEKANVPRDSPIIESLASSAVSYTIDIRVQKLVWELVHLRYMLHYMYF